MTETQPETAIFVSLPWESRLPWEIMAEFWTLPEVLTMRTVSSVVTEAVQDLSPQKCGELLEQSLRDRNMHSLPYGSWSRPVQDGERLGAVLLRDASGVCDASGATKAFDVMMRYLRVLKHLPSDVAVAFTGKYGRHCIPLKWDDVEHKTEAIVYPSCTRDKCPTCRLRIPTADDMELSKPIYRYVDVRGSNERRLNLTQFYSKCIPNLPPDLVCPCCRRTDERTLVLSSYSYRSIDGFRLPLLTYTPREDDAEDETDSGQSSEEDSESDGDEREAKRLRTIDVAARFDFPPMYSEQMFPSKWVGERPRLDSKHAIAIHCVSCQQFGVVSPTGFCWHNEFPCHEKKRTIGFGKYSSLIGGVLVRRMCSQSDCLHAVLCRACSDTTTHEANDSYTSVRSRDIHFCNRCETCDIDPICEDCAYRH